MHYKYIYLNKNKCKCTKVTIEPTYYISDEVIKSYIISYKIYKCKFIAQIQSFSYKNM